MRLCGGEMSWQFMRVRDIWKTYFEILRNAEHPWNAFESIRTNFEQVSNVIDESDSHLAKHDSHNIPTNDKMTIEFNPLHVNAWLSMRWRWESDSNVIDESNLHLAKHDSHNISTDDRITIEFKPLLENADCSIRWRWELDSNVIDESDLHLAKHNLRNTGWSISLGASLTG
jgi:hypothetical protein